MAIQLLSKNICGTPITWILTTIWQICSEMKTVLFTVMGNWAQISVIRNFKTPLKPLEARGSRLGDTAGFPTLFDHRNFFSLQFVDRTRALVSGSHLENKQGLVRNPQRQSGNTLHKWTTLCSGTRSMPLQEQCLLSFPRSYMMWLFSDIGFGEGEAGENKKTKSLYPL